MKLDRKLKQIREDFAAEASEEVAAAMARAKEQLARSGLHEKVLKVGAQAPEFALEDTAGEILRSNQLLTEGPLVVGFYRGVW